MMVSIIATLQRVLHAIDTAWWWGEGILQWARILPRRELEPLEDVVQGKLLRVEPSESFRQALRSELAFAAQQRDSGLVVERPRPFREGLMLGIVCGSIVILGTTLLVALWPRQHAGTH